MEKLRERYSAGVVFRPSHQNQIDSDEQKTLNSELQPTLHAESMFYYFAYGSCMCPVDLKRSLGEITHPYVISTGTLKSYRLGFYRYSTTRKCGVLDVVKDSNSSVKGVLYRKNGFKAPSF
jgi:hypothetical protein